MEADQNVATTSSLGDAVVWIVVTDKTGHINQCIALTDALGVAPVRLDRIRGFNLRDRLVTRLLRRLQGLFQSLLVLRRIPQGPIVLVVSGRSSEYAAKLLRRRLADRLYVVSVGIPIRHPDVADMAIINRASTPKWHRRRERFAGSIALEELLICGALARRFDMPPSPRPQGKRLIAVFVGGENKHFELTGDRFTREVAHIRGIACLEDVEVEIVLSRRTAPRTEEIIRDVFSGTPATIHGRESSDRYRVLLGNADAFIVTPDSVTMLSEVCLTGKPVYALDLASQSDSSGEGEKLVDEMVEIAVVSRFDGDVDTFLPRGRLDEATRIAPIVAARIRDWQAAASRLARPA